MNEQLNVLKELLSVKTPPQKAKLRVIAVTSGKGGVGKTSFTVNLSIALVQLGHRVIIMDGDLGMANVDITCGITPRYSFEHMISEQKSLEEILVWGPNGIGIIPGGSGIQDLANLERHYLEMIIKNLGRLEALADMLIIDTGAGLGYAVMNFLKAADDIILVTTAEPTALTDAYGLIKALRLENPDLTVHIVVNRVRSEAEGRLVFERLENAVRTFLGRTVSLLGWVYEDAVVGKAIMNQEPFAISHPQSSAYQCIQWIAGSISGLYKQPPKKARGIGGFIKSLLKAF